MSGIKHSWNVSPQEAVKIQKDLRQKVLIKDTFSDIQKVAGIDVGFEDKGSITRAAVVVLELSSLNVVDSSLYKMETVFPYVPGLLSFREIPAILKAFESLEHIPDLLLCDGQGIAHPRRLGIATHLGLWLDLPSVGVAKSRLIGTYKEPPMSKGSWTYLLDGDEKIGAVLRTRENVKPLFISPGHRMSLESSLHYVMKCVTKYKLPETTRRAHHLASIVKDL